MVEDHIDKTKRDLATMMLANEKLAKLCGAYQSKESRSIETQTENPDLINTLPMMRMNTGDLTPSSQKRGGVHLDPLKD